MKEIYTGTIQEAVCVTEDDSPDVLSAIKIASESMRAKKLLDRDSSHSGILTSLIRTLQECDSDTEHHVRRTQLMGAELGKRIGLTESDQSRLALLCLLHDIGKIGIPLEILNKPGKLSDEEWKIIQTHTEKGYEIANSNNELRVIADEIRHHHERWDGMGYPDGLSRESIPLLARVIAVVDAFDAMTNRRSYRGAMSVASAIDELKRCAGSQFDPHIVSEFLSMLKENPPAEPDRESTAITATESPAENTLHMSEADECTSVYPVQYSRYILDSSMRIIDVDENFEKLTGYSAEDIRLRDIYQADLIPKEERTEYLCHTSACLAKNTMLFQEHRIQKKDGSTLYVMCFGRVYFDSVVRSERSEIIIADISKTQTVKMITDEEQNRAQIRLKQWENTFRRDSLTGLLNHAAFRSDVELRLLDGTTKVMMLMMDIDKFKNYNDTYGHFNGDKLLISVAQALKSALDEDDCVCRMGGDEFAVAVFFNVRATDAETIAYAQKIFEKVSQTLKNTEGDSGISMGMAMSVPDSTFTQLYEVSDKALYQAKQDGRGRLVIG